MTDARREFEIAMTELEQEHGEAAAEQAYRAFAVAARWLRTDGHGSAILPAIDHRFGRKIKFETVRTVAEAE